MASAPGLGAEPGSGGFDLDRAGALARVADLLAYAAGLPARLRGSTSGLQAAVLHRAMRREEAFRQARDEGVLGDAMAHRMAEIEAAADPRHETPDASAFARFSDMPAELARRHILARHEDDADGSFNPLLLAAPFLQAPEEILAFPFNGTTLRRQAARSEADIAAGGARRDLALARLATGTGVMLLALDAAQNSLITGEHSGNAPTHSLRAGERWWRYDPQAPIGRVLALAADTVEAMHRGVLLAEDIDDWQELIAGGALTVAQRIVDRRTFVQVTRLFAALHGPQSALSPDDALATPRGDARVEVNAVTAGGRRRPVPAVRRPSLSNRKQS